MTDFEFKEEFEKRVNEYSDWLYWQYDKAEGSMPTMQEVNKKLLDLFGKSVFKFGDDYVGDIVYDGMPFTRMYPIDPRRLDEYDW